MDSNLHCDEAKKMCFQQGNHKSCQYIMDINVNHIQKNAHENHTDLDAFFFKPTILAICSAW